MEFSWLFFRFVTTACIAGLIFLGNTIVKVTGVDSPHGLSSDPPFFYYQRSEYPKDCSEVFDQCSSANSSGVYYIKPAGYFEPFEVYCDKDVESGGWTVIQTRHMNESTNFGRNWDSYERGFGFLSQDFWLGNEKLSFLTNQKNYELLVEMTTSRGTVFSLSYNNFRTGDKYSDYRLVSLSQNLIENVDITWCPEGLYYGDCTCGQRTCNNPKACIDTCTEGEADSCVPCPGGFYVKGDDCVPQRECGCYVEEDDRVIAEGEFYTSLDCTRKLLCSGGLITAYSNTTCGPTAVCDERNGIRKCYCDEGYTGDGNICVAIATAIDCQDLYDADIRDNGIYSISPTSWPGPAFEVYCNMSDGGGWIVFQRRVDGTVDFYRGWASYKEGFGTMTNEFWLGNEKLYYLTNQGTYQMRIDFVNSNGAPYYAKYSTFRINNEADYYRLVLGSYSGTAYYDALDYHRDQQFTTKDRDRDAYYNYNCAVDYHGAWWYNNCHYSNLNGGYHNKQYTGVRWNNLPGNEYEINYTEMKIRPV